jgi:hypothetical protein
VDSMVMGTSEVGDLGFGLARFPAPLLVPAQRAPKGS